LGAIWRSLATFAAAVACVGATEAPKIAIAPGMLIVAPIQVPIVDGGLVQGLLTVKLVLVSDAGDGAAVTAAEPRLRSALLSATGEFARLRASPYLPVDAAQLSADVSAAARRELKTVKRVLIVEVSARPA
jgi:hypothetical protein